MKIANEGRDGDGATATADERSSSHGCCKIKEPGDSSEGLDSISSMPDVILQVILSLIPTRFAIRTSVLSRRWRHVWSYIPSLYFHKDRPDANSINETLARYKAPKMMSFRICTSELDNLPNMDSWIKFALSRNVENLSLYLERRSDYNIPEFLYVNSSVKNLCIESIFYSNIIPKCCVLWTSLKNMSLWCCKLSDESIAKILFGCPILESLTLCFCKELKVLDLSKSPRLKTLVIYNDSVNPGPTKIVAPHIHRLRLKNTQLPCDLLVDVSSLTEAKLDISYNSYSEKLNADLLHIMVLERLDKCQNVETLTLGESFLEILSLAELRGVPFPKFKAKALTLETPISHYVIPGIVRVLQNSPELKKLTLKYKRDDGFIPGIYIDENLHSHGLDTDKCWTSEARVFKDICPLRAYSLFLQLVLKTTETLEKMVVMLEPYFIAKGVMKELLEMIPLLTRNINVSIVKTRCRFKIQGKRFTTNAYQQKSKPSLEIKIVFCGDDADMRFKLHDVHIRRRLSRLADSYISPASVNSGIRALIQKGEYLQALHLYTKHDGSSPLWTSVFTFPSLLKACSSLTNLSYGKTIHGSIIVLGWRYDPFIATSLVNMYVKCGFIDYAVQVFDGWSQSGVSARDVTVCNSMIDGYFKFRRFKEGVGCFRRMLVLGVRPDAFSLSIVVSVLCKEGNFRREDGKQIHGYMLRNSLDGDSFLKTALIDMYFKFGLSTDAWRVFVEIEDKSNVVLWNVMIVGFGGSGICESSLELYMLAKSNSVKLVSTSFTGALGACSQSENSAFGRQIHCDVVKMGLDNDPYVSTSLLSMYSKCGMVGEAETVFSCVVDKRLEIWNAMVAAYVENDNGYSALELFGFMRQKSVLPDSFTLSNVISCCSMFGLYDYGKSVHAELFKRPIQSTPAIESALLTLYSKCGCDTDAYLVFKSMEEKDMVAWGSLISGLCKNGKFKEALKVFGDMKDDDDSLKPDSDIMTSVINACAGLEALSFGLQVHGSMIKTGQVLNVFVGSSLIDLYSKCGLPEMALKVFTSMRPENIVAWNSMISCYSRNNLPELSIELFNLMLRQGIFPDSVSITSVLVAISSTASLLKGKSLHGYTLRLGIPSDTHLKNALIDMYVKCGFSKYAENIFKKMQHKSLITWNLMIYGYGSHGDCRTALSLFDELKKAGETPDDVTFLSLISACNHSGFVEEGKNFFEIMKQDYGIEPKMEHYANMVDLLGRAGRLEEAYSFIKAMPTEADSSIWLCLLSASRTHHNVELGILSAEKLLRMEPERGSTYVQLINLYMEAGLKNEAAKLLGEMKERGLQKQPGCSWIEVSDISNVFFSGGSSSPIKAEIFKVLNRLKSNMVTEDKDT